MEKNKSEESPGIRGSLPLVLGASQGSMPRNEDSKPVFFLGYGRKMVPAWRKKKNISAQLKCNLLV